MFKIVIGIPVKLYTSRRYFEEDRVIFIAKISVEICPLYRPSMIHITISLFLEKKENTFKKRNADICGWIYKRTPANTETR